MNDDPDVLFGVMLLNIYRSIRLHLDIVVPVSLGFFVLFYLAHGSYVKLWATVMTWYILEKIFHKKENC